MTNKDKCDKRGGLGSQRGLGGRGSGGRGPGGGREALRKKE